ncbi:SLATT domain-containing protein [Mesorhizobium sp. B2-8-3]|uniref:SLATT domain-containing protein n=1 Tax=Mesorhizobium sp. B2-8-3 TaxID=2589905 RepID=UPI0011271DB7|nr:SLATT domain-containing protein [Mesorhizobium sp. B2-8-3]TPJ36959.1 SLATT domain-containing protein [Mesorhizobium sp. B2-8-3]
MVLAAERGRSDRTRAMSLEDRKSFYDKHRIHEQRNWYAKKAGSNKTASRNWMVAGGIAYSIAILLVLLRIAYPHHELWPIEAIIVIASSIVGWTQVKKFNELASSYTLTAHEIGIIVGRIGEVSTEAEFSSFVNEAEQAFSREHTQWVARQQSV